MLQSIIGLCRELGVTSCVEGVEDQDMWTLLQDLACDQAQGYLFGRPALVTDSAGAARRA